MAVAEVQEQQAGATGTEGTPQGGTPAGGTPPPATGGQPTGAQTGFTYQEDRSNWVPKHRFDEVNTRAADVARVQGELEAARRQVQALTGVAPSDPNANRNDQIKSAFLQLFPHLEPLLGMSKEELAALREVPQHVSRAQESESRQWARQGEQTVTSISEQVAEAIGAENLDDDQKADVRHSFRAWFQAKCKQEIETTGVSATLSRYENQDPKLIDEFVSRYTKNWITPARRQVTATTVNRTQRRVPDSTSRSQVTTTKRPDKFDSLDDRIAYAADLAKERGMQFGR